jgi:hypothetical protein
MTSRSRASGSAWSGMGARRESCFFPRGSSPPPFLFSFPERRLMWAFSSAQFVPLISKDPSVEVINFCRTPQWYSPRVSFRV